MVCRTARIRTVCVTGTKGKSTTASLIAHILTRARPQGGARRQYRRSGHRDRSEPRSSYAVIEVSSYQAADFDGRCDVAVLTSLYPEHLDWHRTLAAYYRDKLNVLRRSGSAIVNRDAVPAAGIRSVLWFNDESGFHVRGGEIFDRRTRIGFVSNRYLARPHNLSNVCAALTVAKVLGLDPATALAATGEFRALPHRQQEIGEIGGVLYVDDSISTAPEIDDRGVGGLWRP